MVQIPFITLLLVATLLSSVLVALLPSGREDLIKRVSLFLSVGVFLLSLSLLLALPGWGGSGLIVGERRPWIPTLGIEYAVGVDGISLFLVLLTTFLLPIVVLSSFHYISKFSKGYYAILFLLETFMLGAFVSLDLFLFYIFWEAMLIPMFVLIGVWGGERRIYATIKFVLYTVVGSLLMLVAILSLYFYFFSQKGVYSANLFDMMLLKIPFKLQVWLFLAFALSFAIKVPVFPFHTWLPDAHVEAPTGGSVILAGILLKMGTYGFIRFAIPLFPAAAAYFSVPIMVLAVIGIIYGALVAWAQTDVKKLVAYSSISHLGFVMLGLFSLNVEAVNGAVYQMLNHGISTGGLFLLVGMLYERRHTRILDDFGGLAGRMPKFAFVTILIVLSSVGLPGLNGFVGEFLILLGTFTSGRSYGEVFAVISATGVILAAVYLLHMVQKLFFGPLKKEENRFLGDLSVRELCVMIPLCVMAVVMGVFPNLFLTVINHSTVELLKSLGFAS